MGPSMHDDISISQNNVDGWLIENSHFFSLDVLAEGPFNQI